jgi:hypothetical protein
LNVDADCRSLADLNTTCGNEGRLRDYLMIGIEPRLNASFKTGTIRHELNVGFRVHREDQDRIQKNGDAPNSRDGSIAENNDGNRLLTRGFVQHRFIWRDFAFTPAYALNESSMSGQICSPTAARALPETLRLPKSFRGLASHTQDCRKRPFLPECIADLLRRGSKTW